MKGPASTPDPALGPREARGRLQRYWFFFLISAICLEGLGRKYLAEIPSIAFYVFKDVVLVVGYFLFKPSLPVRRVSAFLFRGFGVVWVAALFWTLIEILNPESESIPLAMLGLRAYWLWWLAPIVVASAIRSQHHRNSAIYTLSIMALAIAILAAVQFVSPPDSVVNVYTVGAEGETLHANIAMVSATGRPRVSSTFTFLTGFADFTILVPALLLSLGLETSDRRLRTVALVSTLCSAAVLPMSGSRASIVLGALVLAVTCWSAGLFFTVVGRRIMISAIVGAVLASVAFPEALFGVQSRFDPEETEARLILNASIIPPVALLGLEYPAMGIGTGMQQNARGSFGVTSSKWTSEIEMHRYLVELGAIGFCLVWLVKLGLMVALLRAYRILKRAGRPARAGAALSYGAVTFLGSITFDHVWQSLFFVGAGFILAETVSAQEFLAARKGLSPPAGLVKG